MPLTNEWPDEFVHLVSAALERREGFFETSSNLRGALQDPPEEPQWSLVRGLEYRLTDRPDAADPATRIYSPMLEMTDGRCHPEHVGDATPPTLTAWADALELFPDSDIIQARFGDLLWLRRHGEEPHVAARTAQAALRRLWGYEGLHSIEQADCLVRALNIAKELGDKQLMSATADQVVDAARQSL